MSNKIILSKFYEGLYKKSDKINIIKIKDILKRLSIDNNIYYIPIKIVYLIIYLEKKNYSYKLINIIFKKTLKRAYIKIAKFLYKIIQLKWINIINTAIQNDVQNDILQYFCKIYDLYRKQEGCHNIYIYQTKNIFKYKLGYYRQFKKYIHENIYRTYYFIPFIFSKISKSYIIYNNIFEIIN